MSTVSTGFHIISKEMHRAIGAFLRSIPKDVVPDVRKNAGAYVRSYVRDYHPGLLKSMQVASHKISPRASYEKVILGSLLRNCAGRLPVKRCPVCSERVYFGKFCSWSCVSVELATFESCERARQGMIAKYGADNVSRVPELAAKKRQSNIRYWSDKSAEFRKAHMRLSEDTLEAIYGVRNAAQVPGATEKRYATNRILYGSAHAVNNADVQARTKETSYRRYGVSNPSKNPEIKQKIVEKRSQAKLGYNGHAYLFEDYVTADGRTLRLQGYEPKVAALMEEHGWKIAEAHFPLEYIDVGGRQRHYFPDLLAKRGNRRLLVEVKSTYTLMSQLGTVVAKSRVGVQWAEQNSADYLVVVWHKDDCRIARNPIRARELRALV